MVWQNSHFLFKFCYSRTGFTFRMFEKSKTLVFLRSAYFSLIYSSKLRSMSCTVYLVFKWTWTFEITYLYNHCDAHLLLVTFYVILTVQTYPLSKSVISSYHSVYTKKLKKLIQHGEVENTSFKNQIIWMRIWKFWRNV